MPVESRPAEDGCRTCPGCRLPLTSATAAFHGDACRAAFHNRRKRHGAAVLDAALTWRRYRKRGALAALTRLLDEILREERAAGVARYQPAPLTLAKD